MRQRRRLRSGGDRKVRVGTGAAWSVRELSRARAQRGGALQRIRAKTPQNCASARALHRLRGAVNGGSSGSTGRWGQWIQVSALHTIRRGRCR